MEISKGTMITVGKQSYRIVGKWCGDYVLAPQDENELQVLIYTRTEIEDEIQAGRFRLAK